MTGRPMSSRVTGGMILVAAFSALLLAVASSVTARFLWRAREERELLAAADSLAEAIDREARENGSPLAQAAPEALRESTLPGYRAEVWSGARRIAQVGGADDSRDAGLPLAWVTRDRDLPGGLRLVVAAPPEQARALGVFSFSLAVAAPVCLAGAWLAGRLVAGRVTRPLRDLQARIRALPGPDPLPPPGVADVPDEVRDLEAEFRAVWKRLEEMLRREHEFAANASHELRTPLTRIRLNAERAMADAGPRGRDALAAQVAEVDRLRGLIDSLLVLAQDTSSGVPRAETLNLADVCRRVAARVVGPCEPGNLDFPDEGLVRGDEGLVELAVENLFDNARKFAQDGPVRASIREEAGCLRLEVTTPGARIAASDREGIFDRFRRGPEARARGDGYGLGLALARHAARLHGGDVRCVSAEGEDARFALEIPAWSPALSRRA